MGSGGFIKNKKRKIEYYDNNYLLFQNSFDINEQRPIIDEQIIENHIIDREQINNNNHYDFRNDIYYFFSYLINWIRFFFRLLIKH